MYELQRNFSFCVFRNQSEWLNINSINILLAMKSTKTNLLDVPKIVLQLFWCLSSFLLFAIRGENFVAHPLLKIISVFCKSLVPNLYF
jgi:hypothetical protein